MVFFDSLILSLFSLKAYCLLFLDKTLRKALCVQNGSKLNCIYVFPPKSKTSSGFLFLLTVNISRRFSTQQSISSLIHYRQFWNFFSLFQLCSFKKDPNGLQLSNLLVIHVDTFFWPRSCRKALFCYMNAKNSIYISKSYSDVFPLTSSSKVKTTY